MKSILNKEINLREFLPSMLIPRNGCAKALDIYENHNQLLLRAKRCKDVIINKNMILDENDFIAIGLYFAEGDKYVNLNKKYHHSGEIGFVNNDIKCVILVIELVEKLGIVRDSLRWRVGLNIKYELHKDELISYWVKNLKLNPINKRPKCIYRTGNPKARPSTRSSKCGCLHINHSSVIFRNLFLNLIYDIFDLCIKHRLKEELALILKGFFAGDGNVNYCEKYNNKQIDFANNDLDLLNKIRESLRILGLKSIKETWPERTKSHNKSLRIYNRHDFNILNKHQIPYLVDYKRENFKKIMESY